MPATAPSEPSALRSAGKAGQVAFHTARERIVRQPATRSGDVPVDHTRITNAWLDAVLCAAAPGARVERYAAREISSGTSERWALSVTYNAAGTDAGLPTALFAKTTLSFRQRLFLGLTGFISSEPAFFGTFRSRLEIEAPLGYHGSMDPASWRSIVLLEDIAETRGAAFSTPRTPITKPQMLSLLDAMATLHGTFWNDATLAQHAWLKTPARWYATMNRLVGMERRAKVGVGRAAAVLAPGVAARQDELFDALGRSLEIASTGPLTLLHGDAHVGNTYRAASGAMGLVDWQVILNGSWAYDVGYLLSAGLTVTDRRAWEGELLTHYLERLQAAGGEAPALEDAWRAYREQLVYPYFAWLFTIGRSALQPRFQPDEVSLALLERMSTAIADHGTADLLLGRA